MTASSMATMSFMSTAPRPHTTPSTSSPPNGSRDQASASTGTTSMWLRRTSGGSGLVTDGSARSRAKQLPRPGAASSTSAATPAAVRTSAQ